MNIGHIITCWAWPFLKAVDEVRNRYVGKGQGDFIILDFDWSALIVANPTKRAWPFSQVEWLKSWWRGWNVGNGDQRYGHWGLIPHQSNSPLASTTRYDLHRGCTMPLLWMADGWTLASSVSSSSSCPVIITLPILSWWGSASKGWMAWRCFVTASLLTSRWRLSP